MRALQTLGLGALVTMVGCSAAKPAEKPQPKEPEQPAAAPDAVHLAFEKYTLKNGLTVILHEDHRVPTVTVDVWYAVGSVQEPPGRSGFAHLFEHLMFQGSRHVADDEHLKLLELAGATDFNGTTGQERTNYFETLPREELPLALWLESDRMGFLLDTLDTRKLNNQRAVVKNERRQSYEGRAYGMATLALYEALFPEAHPFHHATIGKPQDLDAARVDDVKNFFRTYYSPANATLTLAGDFEPAQARAVVEKAFGNLNGPPAPTARPVVTPPLLQEKRITTPDAVATLARVSLAWVTPSIFSKDDLVLDVLAALLTNGKGSRLYKAMVGSVAQDVAADQDSAALCSVFGLTATVAPGQTPESVEKALDAQLLDLAEHGPTDAEVRRAALGLELGILDSLQRTGGMEGRAEWLQQLNAYLHDPGALPKILETYRLVTPQDVQQAVVTFLPKEARVVQWVIPTKPAAGAAPAPEAAHAKDETAVSISLPPVEPWRAKPPAALETKPVMLPVATQDTLDNGLTVMTVPQPGLPLVALMLVSRHGAAQDPNGMLGLNALATAMLAEGLEGGDAAAQADLFGDLGAQLMVMPGVEATNVAVIVHKRHAGAALDLLKRTVTAPSLQAEAFTKLKRRRLTHLDEQLADPTGAAMHLMNRLGLGGNHPYGHPQGGTAAGLGAVTLEAVKENLTLAWAAKKTALVVVGDLTAPVALELAKEHLAGMVPGDAVAAAPAAVVPAKRVALWAVEKPGAPQTLVVALHPAMAAGDPDAPALMLLNAVFGGAFSSRLNLNLREDKGVTYGAYSMTEQRRSGGLLAAMAPVQADATALALKEMLAEVNGMTQRAVTEAELKLARQQYSRSLPAEFSDVASIAGAFTLVFALDLPLDHYATLPQRYAAVTQQDEARLARTIFKADEMQYLLLGDKAQLEKAALANAVGTLSWVDADGNPKVAAPGPSKKKGKKK